MSTPAFSPSRHPVAEALARLHEELDAIVDTPVWSMDATEAAATVVEVSRLGARVAELELRVAGHADRREAGQGFGATSTANWWAVATRQSRAVAHRKVRLAVALDGEHEQVRDAMAAGEATAEQAQVIVDAVDALPLDLVEPQVIEEARATLIGYARDHDPKALKILGRRILDVIAPEIGEAHEARQLEAEERLAAEAVRLTLADDGKGRCHGRFTVSTLHGEMLRKQLLATAAPKHQAATAGHAGEQAPLPQRMGQAFTEWIERYPADRLPTAGGTSATVVVTMTLETLMGGLASASLDTGAVISPGQARRLACEAGIIPAVLDGDSRVLYLGRRHRLHNQPQRIALGLRDKGCTAEGCDAPPGLCHAHHQLPWSKGGDTSLDNGRLLCPRHHTLAHDPHYATNTRPNGKITFTRRT